MRERLRAAQLEPHDIARPQDSIRRRDGQHKTAGALESRGRSQMKRQDESGDGNKGDTRVHSTLSLAESFIALYDERLRRAVVFILLLIAAACAVPAWAERLPIQSYGPAEGLPSTFVLHVMRDSRGFVWFSTRDGLSRFDGVRFGTYGTEDGLPDPTVNALLERRDGSYWIATNGGGVCQFDPDTAVASSAEWPHRRLFRVYPVGRSVGSNRVNTLFEDHAGRLWAGTDAGLFQLDGPLDQHVHEHGNRTFHEVSLGIPDHLSATLGVSAIAEDADHTLWIGTSQGLVRLRQDGRRTHFSVHPSTRGDAVHALLFDAGGRLWLGHQTGLVVLQPFDDHDGTREAEGLSPSRRLLTNTNATTNTNASHRPAGDRPASDLRPAILPFNVTVPLPSRAGESRWFALNSRRFEDRILALQLLPDGHIWLGTSHGLMEFDGARFQQYSTPQGLSDFVVTSLAADADGNLWAATMAGGAMKLTRRGFRSYDETDGLGDPRIQAIFEDRQGAIVTISGDWIVNRFDGHRFTHAQSHLSRDLLHQWNSQVGFLDSHDQWWLLTNRSVIRLPRGSRPDDVAGRPPAEVLDGLDAAQLYEDRRGDVWIALRTNGSLAQWTRRTGRLRRFTDADGLPPAISVSALTEDLAGNVWLGSRTGDLLRYKAGRFTRCLPPPAPAGPISGIITSLYTDTAGRVWAGSNRDGLLRVDEPDSPAPRLTSYSRANGLSSDNVRSIVSDRWGRVYVGTARGVDRLDPDTGRVQHYTTTDGLLSGFVTVAYRDAQGDLWFGTMKGLSRLRPERDAPRESPPILIDGLSIAGTPQPVAQLGQAAVRDVIVPANQRELQIAFFGIALGAGEALRYRYMLEGMDHGWRAPVDERTVRYSALPPRAYRFLVKAVRADGTESERPAVVQFTVLPALWQRTWFQLLLACGLLLSASTAYRLRVARLLALERVRTRIASDLHDDIGATLAQIAILSEVVQQQMHTPESAQMPETAHAPNAPLARIAQRSREAIASMSDIVWAINPQKDSLRATVFRMREFASEVLPARGIAFQFDAPEADIPLSADLRRHLYLIFKEAVSNLLRHSDATHAVLALRIARRQIVLRVTDNGRGFDPDGADADAGAGHGLVSMTQRARLLKGTLAVTSRPGETVIEATIPYPRGVGPHLFW
jgi:ligand-binding sensor domain-containing protein/signal transduction histidine kinase